MRTQINVVKTPKQNYLHPPTAAVGHCGVAVHNLTFRYMAACESPPWDSPFEMLQVPLDAHVTVGSGKRVDCRLPVVSAADEDVIEGLVTSLVCQRFVWDMPLPVIGFSLSKSGSTAQLVIGWSECEDKMVSFCVFMNTLSWNSF